MNSKRRRGNVNLAAVVYGDVFSVLPVNIADVFRQGIHFVAEGFGLQNFYHVAGTEKFHAEVVGGAKFHFKIGIVAVGCKLLLGFVKGQGAQVVLVRRFCPYDNVCLLYTSPSPRDCS